METESTQQFGTLAQELELRERFLNANANVKRPPYNDELLSVFGGETSDNRHRRIVANRLNGFILVGIPELRHVRSKRWQRLLRLLDQLTPEERKSLKVPLSVVLLVCDEADAISIEAWAHVNSIHIVVTTTRKVLDGSFLDWTRTEIEQRRIGCLVKDVTRLLEICSAVDVTPEQRTFIAKYRELFACSSSRAD